MNVSADSTASPYYFISYSRQEVTFVDSLSRELEKRGIHTWVDFRNLVPGHTWQEQLDRGVRDAQAVLLVVSKASMSSRPVRDEWTKSLAAGRRIILIIFEPCKLDPGLAGLEWVDFSSDFDTGLIQLKQLLESPQQENHPSPPEAYTKSKIPCTAFIFPFYGLGLLLDSMLFGRTYLPKGVQGIFFLGMLEIFISFLAIVPLSGILENGLLSLAIPAFVLLPALWNFVKFLWQVRRRTHNALKLRNAIYGMVIVNLLSLTVAVATLLRLALMPVEDAQFAFWVALLGVLGGLYLYRLLTSDAMYRWAGPTGAILRAARPDLTAHMNNQQTLVALEYAPQDEAYAQSLKAAIVRAGHHCTEDLQEAKIVLTLISAYKNSSSCNPEEKPVIPVLLQSSNVCNISKSFSKFQWIDLRYGQVSMDAVAHLLDEPDVLLHVLGVLPVRTAILPSRVGFFVSLISFVFNYTTIFTLVTLLMILATTGAPDFGWKDVDPAFYKGILLGFPLMAGTYLLRSYIIQRRFWLIRNRVNQFYESNPSNLFLKAFAALSKRKRESLIKIENTMNERLGSVEIPYRWVLGGMVFLALIATAAYWDLAFLFLPVWLIPLSLLSKEIRLWLPTAAKSRTSTMAKREELVESSTGASSG